MKKLICFFIAALMLTSSLSLEVFASETVGYIAYNKGSDSNDGLSAATPKKSVGSASGRGAFSIVSKGGTLVVCEKMYIGANYTWKATDKTTITASYGGADYKNTAPASNPASGVFKMKSGCKFTVASDLTFDDIILHSENMNDTIVVASGGTLTVTESVITTSNKNSHYVIVVQSGGKAIINGGTFASVTGDGEITVGGNATIAGGSDANGAVGYIAYNTGKNSNDGLTEKTAKSGIGQMDGSGIVSVVKQGGTVVVCEKMYVANSFAWCGGGKVTITANYGGKDYKNTSPASNPSSGVIKFKPGSTFTVGSSITLDDVILFQENAQCNIVVSPGATFTVTDSVITMSNRSYYMNLYVSKGATAIINGGTFSSISGEGTIRIGPNVTVLEDEPQRKLPFSYKSETIACYVNYNGNNENSGESAELAVKDYANGLFQKMLIGGTAVINGSSRISGSGSANEYAFPTLPMPLTVTSVYGGADHRTDENCNLTFSSNTTLVVSSDVTFDGIVLLEEAEQTVIRVTNGATLTVTDSAVLKSKLDGGAHYKIIVEKGSFAILSATAKETFTVTGEGTVLTYIDGKTELFNHYLGNN